MSAPLRLGLLHTVPALATTFDALVAELAPGTETVHVVDASLLARAVGEGGVSAEVSARAVAHTGYLAGLGVDAVLVTCSSIGECADLAARDADVPVLRVDRPMARRAVALAADGSGRRDSGGRTGRDDGAGGAAGGDRAVAADEASGRIAVLATLSSTLGPTTRLVEAEVAAAGARVEIDPVLVVGAAEARGRGDQATHDELVRRAVGRAAQRAAVVVLAQASMADALAGADPAPVPVLSSPTTGLEAAIVAAQRR
ncbi:hypothetical protein [Georgenia wangjunii]|uniref:hypothetical protein n=1 Tax=Georgenia wangjunii TaxID=3117730 RepID=UPI002F261C29